MIDTLSRIAGAYYLPSTNQKKVTVCSVLLGGFRWIRAFTLSGANPWPSPLHFGYASRASARSRSLVGNWRLKFFCNTFHGGSTHILYQFCIALGASCCGPQPRWSLSSHAARSRLVGGPGGRIWPRCGFSLSQRPGPRGLGSCSQRRQCQVWALCFNPCSLPWFWRQTSN